MNKREGILNQYRDWLIPVSLFTAMSASVFLFVISINKLTCLLFISAALSIVSIISFILNLLLAFTKLELIEIDNKEAKKSAHLFRTALVGILTFCGSIGVLAFWKSDTLGFIINSIFLIMFFLLFYILKKALENN